MTRLFKEYLQLLKNNFLIIGPSQAGKTSILFRLKTGKFLEDIKPTIGVYKDVIKSNLVLEIGGQIAYRNLWEEAIKNNPRVILFVIDITKPNDLECFQDFIQNYECQARVLLIANKIDLQKGKTLDLGKILDKYKKNEILLCSAKTGENIWRLGELIAELSLKSLDQDHKRIQPSIQKDKSSELIDEQKEIQALLDQYKDKF
ncbi:MAG: ADP-ribosylation factor-like protein [Candidatus Hodarchaeales archaeon]